MTTVKFYRDRANREAGCFAKSYRMENDVLAEELAYQEAIDGRWYAVTIEKEAN